MPSLTIDGRAVPFETGETVMQAAWRAGINIPHYCWHPKLSIAANCRMCLIEVVCPPGRPGPMLETLAWDPAKREYLSEKKPKLLPACHLVATDGMNILSDTSEHVTRARAAVQEFLLLNHPVDCPICDQAGECRLQDYWLAHQHSAKRMLDTIIHKPKAKVFGPLVMYDAERCILCTRCVRFCEQVAKDPVLSVTGRGDRSEIAPGPNRQLDHPYSLMTVHLCPVGALTARDFRFRQRVWMMKPVPVVCPGCATGCLAWLDIDPNSNTPLRLRPRDLRCAVTAPGLCEGQVVYPHSTESWMCDQGMAGHLQLNHDRLRAGRVSGRDCSAQQAIDALAESLSKASSSSVAFVFNANHSVEDNFALYELARSRFPNSQLFLFASPNGVGDDILRSGETSPNLRGVKGLLPRPEGSFSDLTRQLDSGGIRHVVILGGGAFVRQIAHNTDSCESGANCPNSANATTKAPAPNNAWVRSLSKLETLAVIAPQASELTEHATIALGCRNWAEASGIWVNDNGVAQLSRKALASAADIHPAWWLIALLSGSLGFPATWQQPAEIRKAIQARYPTLTTCAGGQRGAG